MHQNGHTSHGEMGMPIAPPAGETAQAPAIDLAATACDEEDDNAMATQLDESQPYGSIGGNHQPAGFDRPAVYEQAGRFFDIKGRLIEPGVPLDPEDAAADHERERAEAEAKALAQADAEMLAQRKAEARRRALEREKGAESRARASSPSLIWPPYELPEFDRPAHYEQGSKFLDEHGREIVPGQPLTPEVLAAAQKEEADAEGLTLTQVINKADTLPFNVLLAASRAVIGPTCPRSKEQVVAQLRLLARKRPNDRVPRIRAAA